MNHKKIVHFRREIKKMGFNPDKGAGLMMYKTAKENYKKLNWKERTKI